MKLSFNHFLRGGLLVFALLATQVLVAQRTITGTVTDSENGEPLIGANVLVVGTSSGTITDFDGTFTLDVPETATELEFSYTGYGSKRVNIANTTTVEVTLVPGELLDEIVVVGYGSVKKEDLTGAVNKVDSREFNQGAIVSPTNLIAGKVAGVQVQNNSGEPGAGTSIRIRGGTSITASNEPLFVIDGVPIDNGSLVGGRNPLNFLSPNDIADVTILKDASATAIYGSRGANGVVIITTVKGKAGQPGRIVYDGYFTVSEIREGPQSLDAESFRNFVAGTAPGQLDQLGNASTDWFDLATRSGLGQAHNLSFTGGGENLSYRASVGYQDIEGVLENSSTERFNYNVGYSHSFLNGNLDVSANLKGALTNDEFDPGVVGQAASFDPTQSPFDPTATEFAGFFTYDNGLAPRNPLASLSLIDRTGRGVRNLASIEFGYDFEEFVPGLNSRVILAYDDYQSEFDGFTPTTIRDNNFVGQALVQEADRNSALLEAYLDYTRDFGQLNFKVTAGYSYQDFENSFKEIDARDLSTDIFGTNNLDVAERILTRVDINENRLISFYGRLNFNFDERYLLTGTLRRDGSTRFGPDNRWGWFPSAAFAWRILQEDFATGLNEVFSDLKLRVGWGITGNQDFGNYLYLPTLSPSDPQTRYQFGDEFITTIRPNGYDPALKWEETSSTNIGLDFGFAQGRLTASIDAYYKRTDDLLLTVNVPAGTNLTDRVTTNIGEIENEGIELTVSATVLDRNKLNWQVSANAAYNRNEVLNISAISGSGILTGGISGGVGNQVQIIRVGEAVNSFFLFEQQFDSNGTPIDGPDANSYADLNEDGMVNDLDKRPVGNPAPDVLLGLTSNLTYGSFDLSFTLRGSIGNDVYNNNASSLGFSEALTGAGFLNNLHESVLVNQFTGARFFSDVYLEDASFLRMDNVRLGYRVPNLGGVNLMFYGTVQNVFVLTEYSGLDPEVGGIDINPYPRPRTFVFGVNLGL